MSTQKVVAAHDGSEDQFGFAANFYASSRPSYPLELVRHFVSTSVPNTTSSTTTTTTRKNKTTTTNNNYLAALDVAAGSGQLSVMLAEYFDHVVALDKSVEQLKHGHRHNNVTYCAGVATQLPYASSVTRSESKYFDVVTCAQACHWFVAEGCDEEFLKEVCRVLNPSHGRLGIFGYGVCSIVSSPSLEKIFKEFHYNELGSHPPPSSPDCYWDIDRRLLDNSLEGISTYPSNSLLSFASIANNDPHPSRREVYRDVSHR